MITMKFPNCRFYSWSQKKIACIIGVTKQIGGISLEINIGLGYKKRTLIKTFHSHWLKRALFLSSVTMEAANQHYIRRCLELSHQFRGVFLRNLQKKQQWFLTMLSYLKKYMCEIC